MAITDIDEAKLEAFIGLAATELGAALNAALVTLGDELGLYRAMADGAARHGGRAGRAHRHARSATCASGSTRRPRAASWTTTGRQLRAAARARARARRRDEPVPDDRRPSRPPTPPWRRASRWPSASSTARASAGTSTTTACGTAPSARSRSRYRTTCRRVAAGARRRRRQARGGRARRRRRLRPRRLDDPDGAGVPGLALRRRSTTTPSSIETARGRAEQAGVADRVTLRGRRRGRLRRATGYDLIAFFDAFHDLGDPLAAARHAAAALAPGGTCMLVEPFAGDTVEENLNPIGRFYYGISTLVCTPGLAVAARPRRARHPGRRGGAAPRCCIAGGFGAVRRAAETPLNLVLEARLA